MSTVFARWIPAVVLLSLLLPQTSCSGGRDPASRSGSADLVLLGGRLVTVDTAQPEAQALAIVGDRIVAVGSTAEIRRHVGPGTRVIELRGRLAIPGFIEGHGHFLGLGEAMIVLDLTRAEAWDDVVDIVAEAALQARPGEWIRGRGWHQEKWRRAPVPSIEGGPVHGLLSEASPRNPVHLVHASGHASFANARALELAGITRSTPDPPGGEIVRDAEGNATGLLRETAQALVGRVVAESQSLRSPAERAADELRLIELAGRQALANGVTTFHDAGVSFSTIDLFRRLADEGRLPVRIYAMVRVGSGRHESETNESLENRLAGYRIIGYGDHHLTVRAIKRQVDGALGAHGAWLLEPYTDLPRSTGLVLEPLDDISRTAELAVQHGYQLNTHAIGDRGNREILDLYERVYRDSPDLDLRWRVEHAQHLHPRDIPRFGELGVIASMQGVHATSDGPWVPAKLGDERAEGGAYVWQELWRTGAVVTNGTDTPVEDISPIQNFYASVSRRLADGSEFYPAQGMTREQALRSYTSSNAFAAFEEGLKGSLTPGKLADIVVLSHDIMTIPEDQIPQAEVVYTIVGGKIRYQNPEIVLRPR